ncbi:MAG: hypothetical protein KJ065_14380 [Anaerolineae bacterium]|nr:hypothetical protein [Anaerolineae bacterium]
MVEKVIVDFEGKVRLELRPPFAYLHEISEQVRHQGKVGQDKTNASEVSPAGECSDWIRDCGQYRTQLEPALTASPLSTTLEFTQTIAFPQSQRLKRLSTGLAFR